MTVIKDVRGVVIRTVIVADGIVIKTEDHGAALAERMIVTARHGVGTATVVIVAATVVIVAVTVVIVAVTVAIVAATVVIVVRDFAMALHPEVSTGGSC